MCNRDCIVVAIEIDHYCLCFFYLIFHDVSLLLVFLLIISYYPIITYC